ncbi:hypothetical protein Efla_007174 [Eimeria flavescens]
MEGPQQVELLPEQRPQQQQQQEQKQQQEQEQQQEQRQQERQQQPAAGSCVCSSSAAVCRFSAHRLRRGRCCSSSSSRCCCSSSSSRCCCCCCCSSRSMPHLAAEALSSRVVLNVGGRLYTTTASTLSNCGPHYFSRRLSPPWLGGETREMFVDRNGELFGFILDFLRNGVLCCSNEPWLLQQLLLEARFFCIRQLTDELLRRLHEVNANEVAANLERTESCCCRCSCPRAVGAARSQEASSQGLSACFRSSTQLQQQQQQPPMLQQLQRLHLSGSTATNDQEAALLSACRRGSSSSGRSSNSSRRSSSSTGLRDSVGSADGRPAAPAHQAAQGADTPQERIKLAQIAAAAELAARAEVLRRSLVNDDPDPPEPHTIKDLGDRVLLTDEDF